MPDGFNISPEPDMETTGTASERQRDPRDVSTISFPYADLETAIETARTLLGGGVALSRDQLAGAMGQRSGSGNFSVKVGAARMFGLMETVAGKYQLTRLGYDILDSDESRVRGAMVKAFLNVPLYKRAYDEFRNCLLPPRPHGLDNAFQQFGVAPKQKEKARRAFDNSARLAGFFDHGNDKLIEPVIAPASERPRPPETDAPNIPSPPTAGTTAAGMPSAAEHPFIKGLLLSLPTLGDAWAATDRVKWLQAAAAGFDLMYKEGSPIRIEPID